ncbi:MAG: LytTR family DNA-binding domain-containing protein [Myxococcota bacterium]
MNDVLRVLIADDEKLARARLTRLLAELADIEKAGECQNGQEAVDRVGEGDIDVLLLDIHMPGLNGLDAFRAMGEDAPYVIFTTAHSEHAVEAFDLGAVDYVLKPVEGVRLEKALGRARAHFVRVAAEAPPVVTGAQFDRLAFHTRGGVQLVAPTSISHATFDGQLVSMVVVEDNTPETHLVDLTLVELMGRVPESVFERVHRRAVVNLLQVQRLEPLETGGYHAVMKSGDVVDVSRQSARRLRKRLGL